MKVAPTLTFEFAPLDHQANNLDRASINTSADFDIRAPRRHGELKALNRALNRAFMQHRALIHQQRLTFEFAPLDDQPN
jgi:hypothetical protein